MSALYALMGMLYGSMESCCIDLNNHSSGFSASVLTEEEFLSMEEASPQSKNDV